MMKSRGILTVMALSAGLSLWSVPGSLSAGAVDPGTINIETNNQTIINHDVQDHVAAWQFLSSSDPAPSVLSGDAQFDDLFNVVSAGSTVDYSRPFHLTDGDEIPLVTLVGFDVSVVDLGMTSTSETRIESDGIAGVDYFTGDSSDPADWVAVNDVTVQVLNITTETYHSSRTITPFVQRVANPPVAAVPLPSAAWAGAGLLGLLGACGWVRRRSSASSL